MRYRFFAQQADIEGEPKTAALFRSLADGATGHALGHLELLTEVGDPATGLSVVEVSGAVRSASISERADHLDLYPSFAAEARDEGFTEVAEWMEALARADHADRLKAATD